MSTRILGFDSLFNTEWIRIEKRNIYRLINRNNDFCRIGYITKDRSGTVAIIDRDIPLAIAPDLSSHGKLTDKMLFSSAVVRDSNRYYYKISDRCYLLIGYESDRRLHISLPALVHFEEDDPADDEYDDDVDGDDTTSYEDDDE